MAVQTDAPYIFVAPDGTRAVIGPPPWDQDPDWVGWIATDQSAPASTDQLIVGLDSSEVRENRELKAQADGSVQGPSFRGGRPVTMQGLIPNKGDVGDCNRRQDKLTAALNALRTDGTLTWLEDGSPWKMLKYRLNVPPRIVGRGAKQFIIGFASKRPEIWSADEQSATLTPGDIFDNFTVDDTATAYTYRSGSAANLLVSNGVLSRASSSPAFVRTAEMRTFTDSEVTLKVTTGASVASFEFGLRLKDIDANNTLEIDVANGGVTFFKLDGGTWSTLNGPTALSPALAVATSYWFRARAQGNVLTLEVWGQAPDPTSAPIQTFSYTLSGADATKYGANIHGYSGAEIDGSTPTDWTFDDLLLHPLAAATSSGFGFPMSFPLRFTLGGGAIAQALCVNAGNYPTWPRFVLTGPMTNPVLLDATNGGEMDFTCQLAAGDVMVVTGESPKSVTINGVNRYSVLTGGSWFQFDPGSNDIRLNAGSYGYGASALAYWRHAWV